MGRLRGTLHPILQRTVPSIPKLSINSVAKLQVILGTRVSKGLTAAADGVALCHKIVQKPCAISHLIATVKSCLGAAKQRRTA